MSKAVYAGSFDPITNGHIDILKRALTVFDEVILLIAINPNKKYRFSVDERLEMISNTIKVLNLKGVSVDYYDGYTVEYVKKVGASHMIRGLRTATDYKYELELYGANEKIDSSIDSVYFMSHNDTSLVSSSMINKMFD